MKVMSILQGKAKPPPLRTIPVNRVSAAEAAGSTMQKVTVCVLLVLACMRHWSQAVMNSELLNSTGMA